MKQLNFLIISLFLLSSCYKPVYTEYFSHENYTEFTTHEILIEIPADRKIRVFASRRCPGKTICDATDVKILLTLETKFTFLEGKDFLVFLQNEKIDLNHRRYDFSYDPTSKYSDGTSGVALEKWVVWVKIEEFEKITNSDEVSLFIGEYNFPIPTEELEKWKVLITKNLLLENMEEEDKRTYGTYTETPVSETEVREKFERKAFIEAEKLTWMMVKDSENPEDLKYFLEQYPDSPYAAPARLKLQQLERKKK